MIPTSSMTTFREERLNTFYWQKQQERFGGSREAEGISLASNWSEEASLDEIQTER